MIRTQPKREVSLKFTKTFAVPRNRLFEAWTNPDDLKKWWQLGHGWKLTVVEVDLRVGGKYRIGLDSTQSEAKHGVTGTFREVSIPEKLVYTWTTEDGSSRGEESVVTVEFHDKGDFSELVLNHEMTVGKEEHESTYEGWLMVLDGLRRIFEP